LRHLRSDRGARFFQAKPISADLKDTRRFAPEQVLEYLRNSARPETDFSAALRARNVSGSLLFLIERLWRATSSRTCSTNVWDRLCGARIPSFVSDLLSRSSARRACSTRLTIRPGLLKRRGRPGELRIVRPRPAEPHRRRYPPIALAHRRVGYDEF
jgi:hypothetical protein